MTPADVTELLAGVVLVLVPALVALTVLVGRLRASERNLRVFTDNSDDIVLLFDLGGRCTYASTSVQRRLGLSPGTLVGRAFIDLLHPGDVVRATTTREMVRITGRTVVETYRLRNEAGEHLWHEVCCRLAITDAGIPTGYVITARDVTVRKRAEDLYRVLAASLPDMSVLLYDRDLRIQVAEGQLLSANGYTKADVEGRTVTEVWWSAHSAEDVVLRRGHWLAPFEGRSSKLEVVSHGRAFETEFTPVWMDGVVVGALAVSRDITEQRRRDVIMLERTMDLERSNRDLEQFADIASHELITPLHHISGFAELLSDEFPSEMNDDSTMFVGHILQGVREMYGVIEALLRYSRAKTDDSRTAPVELAHVLRQAVTLLGPKITSTGATLDVEWEDLPTVRGDAVLLKQLFENLLGNALKFSLPDPIITIRARRVGPDWEITVEDNGSGIDAEHREMIFQMFKRNRTDVEGSGVGLALCKKIVGIHRGRIWVEAGRGEGDRPGSAFRFTLPARTSED